MQVAFRSNATTSDAIRKLGRERRNFISPLHTTLDMTLPAHASSHAGRKSADSAQWYVFLYAAPGDTTTDVKPPSPGVVTVPLPSVLLTAAVEVPVIRYQVVDFVPFAPGKFRKASPTVYSSIYCALLSVAL
jgi:hypothetical protein